MPNKLLEPVTVDKELESIRDDLHLIEITDGDVISGKQFMNSAGSLRRGTLSLSGNAISINVLSGYTFYSTDPKYKETGSMTNRGAWNQTIEPGESVTIPAGYHSGSGNVTASKNVTLQGAFAARIKHTRLGYAAEMANGDGAYCERASSGDNAYVKANVDGYFCYMLLKYADPNQVSYNFGYFNSGDTICYVNPQNSPANSCLVMRVWVK